MDKPRCQGCLGELKVERPRDGDPYVWCLRCGARDDRHPGTVIALLERQGHDAYRPRETQDKGERHSPKLERVDYGRLGGIALARRSRSPEAG